MKRYFIYTFAALALVLSCNRTEPEQQSGDLIRIGATIADVPSTKALLNKADLRGGTVNPEVKIYDDLTDFVGTITVGNQTYVGTATQPVNVNYINDTMVWSEGQGENATWNFDSGIAWRWTRTGIHHFYGWLTKDPAGLQNNGDGTTATFDKTTKVLTVPAIAFTSGTPQFDFSYSDIVTKDVNSGFNAAESVNLKLNHLFSAISLTIQNNGGSDATIKSVTIENLNNKKLAQISYAGITPVVTLTPAPAEEQTNFLAGITNFDFNAGGTKYDLITGTQIASSAKGEYFLIWPQTTAEVGELNADGSIKFVVTYTYDGIYDDEEQTQLHVNTAECYLSEAVSEIKAGHKYAINLQFKGKSIDLNVEVLPWEARYFDLDYSTSTIQALPTADNEGVLWLYTWDYDETIEAYRWFPGPRDRLITMDSGKNIKGDFTILSPTSGEWQITTYPADAAQYFTITPSSGTIDQLVDEGGNFKGYVEFIISPNGTVPSIQKLYFNVDIEVNGVWRNANSEFNRKNWELTRLP